MPSTFRSSRSGRQFDSNRTRTGQIDHDVFEGLPVRRWSRQPHTHSQVPKTEDSEFVVQGPNGTGRLPELVMPRDSQLLGAGSRALLRAARAGCIYIHQNTRASDKDEKEAGEGDDGPTGTHSTDRSFTSRKWTTLPKQLEPADVEFLAKRRPGLPSLYGGVAAMDGSGSGPGPMRRTKFQKTDPTTGKISVYEAWVPEGHRIEGEITGDIQTAAGQSDVSVNPEMPAPGTVVEGVGVVNSEGVVVAEAGSASVMTPPKRRPPPPKRKGKGIGKGRKKKVMFAPGEGADATAVHGVSSGANAQAGGPSEGQEVSQMPIDQSGQEDDDEDGEDGEDSDEADESMMDAKTPETPQGPYIPESADQPPVATPMETKDVEMTDAAFESQPSVSQNSSIIGQEVPPEPSGKPIEPHMETFQAEIEPHASATPVSMTETMEPADTATATEKTSDIIKQVPVNDRSPEPPSQSIHPETSSELATAPVLQEEPLTAKPTSPSRSDNIPEALATEPIQAAPEVTASEVKVETESTGENSSAPPSADHEMPVERVIPNSPTKPTPEPELAAESTHSDPSEPNDVDASVHEANNGEENVAATLEREFRDTEPKVDPEMTEIPALSGHREGSSPPEEPTPAVYPKTSPTISPSGSTEPLVIDAAKPSGPSITEPNPEETSLTPKVDEIQPDSPIPGPTESASIQASAATESTSMFQRGKEGATKPQSNPASESPAPESA